MSQDSVRSTMAEANMKAEATDLGGLYLHAGYLEWLEDRLDEESNPLGALLFVVAGGMAELASLILEGMNAAARKDTPTLSAEDYAAIERAAPVVLVGGMIDELVRRGVLTEDRLARLARGLLR